MHVLLHSVPPARLQATTNPSLHWRLLDTHRQVCVSLLWGHCSFLLGPGAHRFCLCPLRVFPQSCVSSVIKSTVLQCQILWGFSLPLPDSQVGKSVVGPRTFLIVREFISYNCSAVCGSSARQLYGGVNGELLQEGLCHTQHCCTQSPCPCSRPLLTHASTGDTQTLKRRSGSVSCGFSGSWCTLSFEPTV